jgi:hypothetical protein
MRTTETANFWMKKHERKSAPAAATEKSSRTAKIKAQLEAAKAKAQKAFESRRRFWFHTALEEAYRIYGEWRAVNCSKKNARKAARLFGLKMKKGTHPLKLIIDVLTPAGVDKRRWVDGLLLAHKEGVAPKDLVKFVQANGGIAGCARRQRA